VSQINVAKNINFAIDSLMIHRALTVYCTLRTLMKSEKHRMERRKIRAFHLIGSQLLYEVSLLPLVYVLGSFLTTLFFFHLVYCVIIAGSQELKKERKKREKTRREEKKRKK
jgi:predicted membrane protein